MLYRKCDRCGKELPRNLQPDAPMDWNTLVCYSREGANRWEADLCPDCNQQVRDFAMLYADEEGRQ